MSDNRGKFSTSESTDATGQVSDNVARWMTLPNGTLVHPDYVKPVKVEPVNSPVLSRRDQFAMAAMQALLASTKSAFITSANLASDSAKIADALIAELDKEPA